LPQSNSIYLLLYFAATEFWRVVLMRGGVPLHALPLFHRPVPVDLDSPGFNEETAL
jgi:hypothetical protein